MKVVSYEAHSVLGVKDIELNLEGRHLFLVGGKNGQGKTSILKSLLMVLCGRSGMDEYPECPLREGESEGWIRVKLTGSDELMESEGFTAELKLRRKLTGTVVEEFRLLDSTGDEAAEPRTLLKKLYNLKAFDPLAFEKMSKKERKLLLEKLLGLDFSETDSKKKEAYDTRTRVNRRGAELASAAKAALDKLTIPSAELPEDEVKVTDLLAELDGIKAVNAKTAELASRLSAAMSRKSDEERLRANVEEQIKKLQEKLEFHDSAIKAMGKEINDLREACSAAQVIDEAEIRAKIANTDTINRNVRSLKEYKHLSKESKAAQSEAESLTSEIESIEKHQKSLIEGAEFPVDGMSFSQDGVLLNGRPFEQSSTKERIMASVEVGMAMNPELKLLVCEDGSALDAEAIAALDEILERRDYQMIVELVTRTKEDEDLCAVVVREGTLAPCGEVM